MRLDVIIKATSCIGAATTRRLLRSAFVHASSLGCIAGMGSLSCCSMAHILDSVPVARSLGGLHCYFPLVVAYGDPKTVLSGPEEACCLCFLFCNGPLLAFRGRDVRPAALSKLQP